MSTTRRHFLSSTALGGLGLVGVPLSRFALAGSADSTKRASTPAPWSTLDYGKISVGGDLAYRTRQNWNRLQHPAFRVPRIFKNMDGMEWPGDWVARTFLHNVLLARSLGEMPEELQRILHQIPSHMNRYGYFGELVNPDALNEQQLGSPVGWLMRGLVEYHQWTQDPLALKTLQGLIHTLALPMKDWWADYPIALDARSQGEGAAAGLATWRSGRWLLSSDIGNQFMVLDGLTQAWSIDRSIELKATIDAGIERFSKMDLMKVQAQTHASLTTARAILRMHTVTGDPRLLHTARGVYDLYRSTAMTEHYANYNWFGRPETWTEPCAIVDSYILAVQLWQATGEPQYLEDAHLIWFNGVGRGQRANGGFGLDNCTGHDGPFMNMTMYEAVFCCTMRGGEGHSYAIQSAFHTRPNEIAVTFYTDCHAILDTGNGQVALEQSTQYPYDGSIQFTLTSSSVTTPITWRFFSPPWITGQMLKRNGRTLNTRVENGFLVASFIPTTGDVLTLEGRLKNWSRPPHNPSSLKGYRIFHRGPLILGHEGMKEISIPDGSDLIPEAPDRVRVKGTDLILTRINDLNEAVLPSADPLGNERIDGLDKWVAADKTVLEALGPSRRQILFRT